MSLFFATTVFSVQSLPPLVSPCGLGDDHHVFGDRRHRIERGAKVALGRVSERIAEREAERRNRASDGVCRQLEMLAHAHHDIFEPRSTGNTRVRRNALRRSRMTIVSSPVGSISGFSAA